MEEIANVVYPPRTTNQTVPPDTMTESELKDLLAELISTSASLNVRVWLDGVYTDIENTPTHREWMKGREVYFKVEGKVDSLSGHEESRVGSL
jgi:hypothetical protein